MSQSRRASLIEACANMASGIVVSFFVGVVFYPMFGIEASPSKNLAMVLVFTFFSLVRSYLWRRFFNWITTRRIQNGN